MKLSIFNYGLIKLDIRYLLPFVSLTWFFFINSVDFISLQRTCTFFVGDCKIAFKIHLVGICFSKIIWGRWVYNFINSN